MLFRSLRNVDFKVKAGEIVVTAKLDPDMRPGVCSIPHGHKDANINQLTCGLDMDPLGGMAHYSAVPIEVVDRLMAAERPDPVLILCKSAGWAWSTAKAIIMVRPAGARTPRPSCATA